MRQRRFAQVRRGLILIAASALLSSTLSGCTLIPVIGGKGADPDTAIAWAKATSAKVLDAIDLDAKPISASSEAEVCTSVDYSDQKWASYHVSTLIPIHASDRLPILTRVSNAFKHRKGWTVLGDDPGEIGGAPDVEEYNRDLEPKGSSDDEGVSIHVDEATRPFVEVDVRSACYVTR